jgi:hypothetical protein
MARCFTHAGNFRFEGLPRNRCTTARSPSNFIRFSNARTHRGLIPSSAPACCCVICRFLTSCSTFSRSRSLPVIHSPSRDSAITH